MFQINQRSSQPIYEQLLENIETMILNGLILKDEKLPSVRSVAQDLAVNPNTIQKAYALLEERGVLYSQPGRGSFVALDDKELKKRRLPAALDMLDQTVDVLLRLGMTETALQEHVMARVQGFHKGGHEK